MLNEFNESKKFEHDPNRLPPDLAALESRLGEIGQTSCSTLDRDELMFQSGYAAAMATKELGPKNLKIGVVRWGWPAVSGTLAAAAAGLAIMLWATPVETGQPQFASKPAEVAPLAVDAESAEPNEVSDAKAGPVLVTTNPIEAVISPYLKNVFCIASSEGSLFGIRNQRLADVLRDEREQPRICTRKSRTRVEPLRAMSFQNQQLWEQL